MLRVLFIGASTVNFGGAPGPWDHSRRLEKLGGVKASTRALAREISVWIARESRALRMR